MNDYKESERTPQRIKVEVDGGYLAGWRWVNDDAQPLLFCHATGFCASAYKQMLAALSDKFDVTALDMRGHGKTNLPADPLHLRSWEIYAKDVAAFLDVECRQGWVLAGHSMGAATVLLAAQGRRDISELRLVEPVALPGVVAMIARSPIWPLLSRRLPMAQQAAERRSDWPSREAAHVSYERKALFADWAPGVLGDYLEDGLAEGEDGVRLSCAPAWEAATFRAQANDLWRALAAAPAPVSVLAAKIGASTVWPFAERKYRRAGAMVTRLNQASHLICMENPQIAADFLTDRAVTG